LSVHCYPVSGVAQLCQNIDIDNIYLLTAVGLTLGGGSIVHINTQTVHGKTKRNRIRKTEHT